MALIPALFLSMFFVILAVVIAITVITIGKIGMSFLGSKMKLKKWGLLWIPLVGSYYDGVMAGFFIKSHKKLWPVIFLISRMIPALCYIVLVIYINRPDYHPGPEMDLSDYLGYIIFASLYAEEIATRVIKMIAMLRGKCIKPIAIIVGLFFPDFWSYFMISKVAKNIEVSDNVIV